MAHHQIGGISQHRRIVKYPVAGADDNQVVLFFFSAGNDLIGLFLDHLFSILYIGIAKRFIGKNSGIFE